MVNERTAHEMRYISAELKKLQELEEEVRASVEITDYVLNGTLVDRLLTELDTLRKLQETGT